MGDDIGIESDDPAEQDDLLRRRDFLKSLRKWSQPVIGAVVFGGLAAHEETKAGWVNRRGSWVNSARTDGWINRPGSRVNGGAGAKAGSGHKEESDRQIQ